MVSSLSKAHSLSLFQPLTHTGQLQSSYYISTLPDRTLLRTSPHRRPPILRASPHLTLPNLALARLAPLQVQPPHVFRPFHTSRSTAMASDEDYMSFLDKANRDPSEGYASAKSEGGRKPFKTADKGVEVPKALLKVTRDKVAFYTSDADEPFEAVALEWNESGRGLPDEEEFAQLIGHWAPKDAEIEIMDPVDWDSSGQYAEIIEAVREAGQGNDVRVYRVGRGGPRFEYWVVTTEGRGQCAKLVGAKALSVES